ncbi:YceI family protein [Colwelliaceae bacterium 6441]
MITLRNTFNASLITLAAMSTSAIANSSPKAFMIDAAHSSVNFSVNHLGFSDLAGRFNNVQGKVNINEQGQTSIKITIDAASIDTNHDKRDVHLKSPDFFNVKQFPEISFSSDFSAKNATLSGEVTLLGKTKKVNFELTKGKEGTDPWGGYRVGYVAKSTIKRSDFGMDFMQGGIGDNVVLLVNIEAVAL